MFLRAVLTLGLALILFAGGAAGWQYWQQHRAAPAAEAAAAPGPFAAMVHAAPPEMPAPAQDWLISPGGGVVTPAEAAPFLRQDRFVASRVLIVEAALPVADLLGPGESLPAPVFAEAFLTIRAPILAVNLCRPLLDAWVAGCRVVEAGPVGAFDPASGMADLRFVLEYTSRPEADPLPDLTTVIYRQDRFSMQDSVGGPGKNPLLAGLSSLMELAEEACPLTAGPGVPCRVTAMKLVRDRAGTSTIALETGWLAPMPQGMYPAPPLY